MSQYYIIRSKMTGLVLTADEGGFKPNAKVTPHDQNGQDNQIWYDDPSTGTIRLKSSNFCLDIEDGRLVVRPWQNGDPNQQWLRADPYIRNRLDANKVLDIYDECRDRGAKVGAYKFHGNHNQCWVFEYTGGVAPVGSYPAFPAYPTGGYPPADPFQSAGPYPPAGAYPASGPYPPAGGYPPASGGYPPASGGYPPASGGYPPGAYPSAGAYPPPGCSGYPAAPCAPSNPAQFQKREFHIVSEMNGKVLDISGENKNAGAKVIMWHKKSPPAKNQLWYVDQRGFIRSAFNDLVLANAEYGKALTMHPFAENPRHLWKIEDKRITNGLGEVLDICGASEKDGAELISYKKGDKAKNQKWRQEYI